MFLPPSPNYRLQPSKSSRRDPEGLPYLQIPSPRKPKPKRRPPPYTAVKPTPIYKYILLVIGTYFIKFLILADFGVNKAIQPYQAKSISWLLLTLFHAILKTWFHVLIYNRYVRHIHILRIKCGTNFQSWCDIILLGFGVGFVVDMFWVQGSG
jgi:hypothetical protein